MELVELTEAHRKEIHDLLMREPHTHLYQIERLKNSDLDQTDDEWRAVYSNSQLIAKALEKCTWIEKVMNVETNIIIGYVKDEFSNADFTNKLAENNILIIPFGKGKIRMVTHLDINESDVDKVITSLKF